MVEVPESERLSIEAAAGEAGPEPGLVAEGRTWSWEALAEAADAERRRLDAAGAFAIPGVPVAFDAHPTSATVVRLLALVEEGAPAMPLHPAQAPAARAAQVGGLGCFDADTGRQAPGSPGSVGWESRPKPSSPADGIRAAGAMPAEPPLAILFTSGSTGSPRAVELSRSAFLASAAASAAHHGWLEDDRWLCCLPLAHVGGLSIVTRCLVARRPVVLVDGFRAAGFTAAVEREAVSVASVVPTMIHDLLATRGRWRAPSHLRAVLMGGAAAPGGLWDEIDRRQWPVLATYGMTETCSQVATGRPAAPRRLEPLEGVEVRIREGRLEVAGPMLCSRIVHLETATSERAPSASSSDLSDCTAFTADGFLRTADLGRLDDGALVIHGRADDTIVTGGENVRPLDVEVVLAGHPAVRRAVVFGIPDARWGEIVAAALERRADVPAPKPDELRRWMSERLAAFQRPRRVAWLDDLPQTLSGKPDRGAARSAALDLAKDV